MIGARRRVGGRRGREGTARRRGSPGIVAAGFLAIAAAGAMHAPAVRAQAVKLEKGTPKAGAAEPVAPGMDREELARRLDRLLADPALARAHVGLSVQIAETGEVLYDHEGEKRFTPASNAKLVTTSVALARLGASYRWPTRLVATGPVRSGALDGDLWIIGSGDPELTREELRGWIHTLHQAGIQRITGDVIGDDRAFVPPQWGTGWMWDDLYGGYSTGVSGLQLHPNTVDAALYPGRSLGDSASFRLDEPGPRPHIDVRVRTGAPGSETRIQFLPPPEGGEVQLTGWIPADVDSVPLYLGTRHPTLYLLDYLKTAMADSGMSVGGETRRVREGETPADSTWGATFLSDSLGVVLGEVLKPSDNQIAESLLRTLGYVDGRAGSESEGLGVVRSQLEDWGIEDGAVDLADGSGLSRYDEVTPDALVRLLRAVWRRPDFDVYDRALPIAGVDGSLKQRMTGMPAQGGVHAKTGSLSAVRALSGYVPAGDGETLIFSLLVNGYDTSGEVTVAIEDLLVDQLSLFRRPVVPGWPDVRKPRG